MDKLLKARNRMAKNRNKGFTLVELIVVIVILAILIAALTPAILGVINRANIAADEADIRSVMMAGSVAGMNERPPGPPSGSGSALAGKFQREFTGGANVQPGTYTICFDGAVAVGGIFDQTGTTTGTGPRSGNKIALGSFRDTTEITLTRITIDIPVGGGAFTHNTSHLTPPGS